MSEQGHPMRHLTSREALIMPEYPEHPMRPVPDDHERRTSRLARGLVLLALTGIERAIPKSTT